MSDWRSTKYDLLPLYLIHQSPKLVNILKISVHAGKPYVSHFVELFQLAHDELANAGALDFAQAQVEEFFFYALYGAVYLLGADGAFAQSQVEAGLQFAALILYAAAVFFDDGGEVDLGALVGGKALFASPALAAAAYEVGVFRDAGVYDLGVEVVAKGAFHGFILSLFVL
jgi:hypothetical protein